MVWLRMFIRTRVEKGRRVKKRLKDWWKWRKNQRWRKRRRRRRREKVKRVATWINYRQRKISAQFKRIYQTTFMLWVTHTWKTLGNAL